MTDEDDDLRRQQQWEGQLAHYIASVTAQREQENTMSQGVISFALLALRGVVIANGAAAIALLAFVGHVWSQGGTVARAAVTVMHTPMIWFASGVAAGLIASALSYLAQMFFLEYRDKEGDRKQWPGEFFRILAIVVASAGIACFVFGIVGSRGAFEAGTKLLQSPKP